MPCSDVSDIIHVVLDSKERLVSYRLIKKTCERAVGDSSLLLPQLKGFDISSILDFDSNQFQSDFEVDEFLALKHLYSLQRAIFAYLGKKNSGAFCEVLSVSSLPNRTEFTVSFSSDIPASHIRPCCGVRCSGCLK